MIGSSGIDSHALNRLTKLIYGAVLAEEGWTDFLDELTRLTGICTHLFGHDLEAGLALELISSGYDPEHVATYNAHYGRLNAWVDGFALSKPGVVIDSDLMCPREEFVRTEFYNEWIRPQEDIQAGGGAILFRDDSRFFAFGGNIRKRDEDRLHKGWLELAALLTPHLQQAFEIARTLTIARLETDLARRERGPSAVLLVADDERCLFLNEAATQMIEAGWPVRTWLADRVTFADPAAAAALGRCLAAIRAGSNAATEFEIRTTTGAQATAEGQEPGRWIVRTARFDCERHRLKAFPLLLGYSRPALLVTISKAEIGGTGFPALYGLTKAEAEVVIGIAEGSSPAELAEQRKVSVHTIRNQIKSAMSKTGSRRQADLVRIAIGR